MTDAVTQWPERTRDIKTPLCDSTRWNWFKYRDGDIVVASYAKSGTTWTQQIVMQLVFKGERQELFEASPWIDFRAMPLEMVLSAVEAQQTRRVVKTHLPVDALSLSPQARYLYVARDGRDMVWSLYNHHLGLSANALTMVNNTPGRVGPPMQPPAGDELQYFRDWLDGGGLPLGASFWEHVQGWWNVRQLPNVLLVHFNNLKTDLPGQMRRIAAFLGIGIDEATFPTLVEHCTFDYMRRTSAQHSPILETLFQGGGNTFFNKGTNGRWKGRLTEADLAKYERLVRTHLAPECAHWLETGELPNRA